MSLIGTLEQLSLPLVLQRIESFSKTGLLIIKQEARWVELYFRDGRLMCIGPVPPSTTLGERLLRAGMVLPQILQEAILATGLDQPGETRLVLTLMDLGHVSHEGLRAWAAQEAVGVLQILLTWQNGDLYFEDGQQPPADRLLVALSPAVLLPSASPVTPPIQPVQSPQPSQLSQAEVSPPVVQQQQRISTPPPGSLSAAQLIGELPVPASSNGSLSLAASQARVSTGSLFNNPETSMPPLTPPQRVIHPQPPRCVDTSFMRPEMVLLPVDLSGLRQQSPPLQVTPEQWRLLTRVDGRTSLQSICQELAMSPDLVRQIAGELIALGVIRPSYPSQQAPMNELSPVSRDLITSGLGNGYVAPGYAAMPPQPWSVTTPTTDALPPPFHANVTPSFETKSQWGNGGNGATFVPGRGWVATPQPLQPIQPDALFYTGSTAYTQIDIKR